MGFDQRSYSGKIFRPKPECQFKEHEKLLVVATPWGSRSGTRRAVDTLTEFFLANTGDSEATSPFRKLPNLSAVANNLRIGILLANEYFFNSENKDEFKNGSEFFAAAFDQKELVWMQIGHPHVMLKRHGRPLLQLSGNIDLSMELSPPGGPPLPPLPGELIGIDANPHIVMNSFRPSPGDKLVLISRSWVPKTLYLLGDEHMNVDNISMILSKTDEDIPYWLGVWSL